MQYQIKLSPSYPQSYPQKGVMPCKTCSDHCKMCSTKCKIRSTTCKICSTQCKIRSTKQSYPQVIPRVIPKKVLYTCKICSTPMQNTQQPMQNVQYHLQNTQHHLQNTHYPMQNTQHYMQNMQHQTKLSPSYPQSYPQWICHRKMDLKNKSKCFILT